MQVPRISHVLLLLGFVFFQAFPDMKDNLPLCDFAAHGCKKRIKLWRCPLILTTGVFRLVLEKGNYSIVWNQSRRLTPHFFGIQSIFNSALPPPISAFRFGSSQSTIIFSLLRSTRSFRNLQRMLFEVVSNPWIACSFCSNFL